MFNEAGKRTKDGIDAGRRRPSAFGLAKIGALVAVSLIATALVSEGILRLVYGDRFDRRPVFYIPDDRLGWKPAADLNHEYYGPDFSMHIRTDSDGYRLGALGPVDYTKNLIVLIGDSYTFGWGVSTNETFASYLDERVSEYTKGATRVVNLGVGGYGTYQSCDRLSQFLEKYPFARVQAVLVTHASNDAVDNFLSYGYHVGKYEVASKRRYERSHLHILNLINYARQLASARRSGSGEPAGTPEDTLLTHQRIGDENPRRRAIPRLFGEKLDTENKRHQSLLIKVDRDHFLRQRDRRQLRKAWKRRKSLTEDQQKLMRDSIGCIHDAVSDREIRILHQFVYNTQDWYIAKVKPLISQARPPRNAKVLFVGMLPQKGKFTGKVTNDHFGGHWTPEMNEFWADEIVDMLLVK